MPRIRSCLVALAFSTTPAWAASPHSDVPMLVKACVNSVFGNFDNANFVINNGYRLQRNSKTKRYFYKKFPVSVGASLNGSYESAELQLGRSSRRRENDCSVIINTGNSPSAVSSAAKNTLSSMGYRPVSQKQWTNGQQSLEVYQSLSGSRVSRRVVFVLTAKQ